MLPVKFKPHGGLRKTHRQFLELEELHDRCVECFIVEMCRRGCEVEKYGLERRFSKKWYFYDYRPDFKVRCKHFGKSFLVDVKSKRVKYVSSLREVKHVMLNVRHVEGYLKAGKEAKLEVWVFTCIYDDMGYLLGYVWIPVSKLKWGKFRKAKAWDGNLVYLVPTRYAGFPL